MGKFKSYWIASLFIVLGLLALYGSFAADRPKTPVELVELKGTLKDYNFINNQAGSNYHYLWLREYKAVFQCREYAVFGNEVASFAKQNAPVSIHVLENDVSRLSDPNTAVTLRGLAIGDKILFQKDHSSSSGGSALLLMVSIAMVLIGAMIMIVQRWLAK